jgi:glycosyltransferase involved in cell wall biosynthesis
VLDIWFWQRIVSPHMAHLAAALAKKGLRVTYVAEQPMSTDRQQQGWQAPDLPGVSLVFANTDTEIGSLIHDAPDHSVHICQGIRSNGKIAIAQRVLSARGLPQWVVMETVDDSGWRGSVKRLVYRRLFLSRRNSLQGVLAIGQRTVDWVAARGMPAERVFPFAYFLPEPGAAETAIVRAPGAFRFVFAGQLIPRKRVDWLINALSAVANQDFELLIVGTGPEEPALCTLAASQLGDRVRWMGRLSLTEVPSVLAQADCLVLPSVHDGWGAVVSEALMAGTPAVCSDACGAAEVVHASGVGGVFPRDQIDGLRTKLDAQLKAEIIDPSRRAQLASWATALGADAGATYLLDVLAFANNGGKRPSPPWRAGRCRNAGRGQAMSSRKTVCV